MKFFYWLVSLEPPAFLERWLRRAGEANDKPDNWAQASHYAIGYGYMLTAIIFTDQVLVPFLAMAVFIFFKEFWFDIRYEKDETVSTGLKDMCSYLIGGVVAVLVACLCFLCRVQL